MNAAPGVPERLSAALRDRYRIERPLGSGAHADVYLATDLKHDRQVALKVMKPELAALVGGDRFVAEVRTTARLQHTHILPLFDSGDADGLLYYVMPYVEGESLRDRLKREGRLGLDEALRVAEEVASALSYAHEHGIVHRDVKPANVLLGPGGALVADFGIALALSELPAERLTATGLSVGTPSYMSPEQLSGDESVDPRSDLWSLGCLLFEMLVGHPPYQASTLPGLMTRVLAEPAPRVDTLRPDVPKAVADVVARALERDAGDRFPTAEAFEAACRKAAEPAGVGASGRRRFPLWIAAAAVAIAGVAAFGAWRATQRSAARASLVEVARLADADRMAEALALAEDAARWIPGDSTVQALIERTSRLVTIASEPAGARVFLQRWDPDPSRMPEPEDLGATPLVDLRLPRVDHRMVLELEGYEPVERILSHGTLDEFEVFTELTSIEIVQPLAPAGSSPPGMVPVPGGDYQLASPDAPTALTAPLEPFFIDRYEVTNAAFAAFVTGGGYLDDRWWDGVPDPVRETLVDRTGLPGPRGWSGQRFAEGAERLPVSGVSWWEAQAYCASGGGRLPTVFEWEKTARAGIVAVQGVMMPWGIQGAVGTGARRANFNSSGPVAVDAFPFGVSPFGAYGMAGNVSEWTLNQYGDGRATTGGSWQGPSYLYTEYASEAPDFASPGLGFRCARSDGTGSQGGEPISLDVVPPDYTPVDRATFARILEFYRYDPLPADPRVTDVVETAAWTRERIWIDGPEGDSVLLYFWTPKSVEPPYQTMVFVPGSSVFAYELLRDDAEFTMGPAVQAGRAMLSVVMDGMLERSPPPGAPRLAPSSVGFRDRMVKHATELRLAMDYAESRDDVDPDGFSYVATSWGAGSRLAFAAVDPRYRAVVLIGAGIDERVKPTLPEADNVNFAPYIDVPTLMINGTNDEEHPWLSRAQPLWELLSEPKDLELVDGAGHMPPAEARIPPMNAFLDSIVGPVRRRAP